jgi:hypothetical protein
MPDMRGLVGIDIGVLDHHFAGNRVGRVGFTAQRGGRGGGAVEKHVDVARPRRFQSRDAGNCRHLLAHFFGDLARRTAQALGQLKGKRQGKLAELRLRRLFDDDARLDAVASFK